MADEKQPSALLRRHEQLKRWEDSLTNKEPVTPKEPSRKVTFQDGCVFLAACSSGDRNEVKRLLARGADINTANVDGLTALHQACIDDNLDMVEFLVENGADVDVCDNEGWTSLHATASCGFTEIARYLLEMGANVSAVNNDGDLPIDICEDDDMEKLLQEEMDRQGVDADAARREEEERMLMDANQWLNSKIIREKKHPKTGATALHVAAAKGYIKVIDVLLQAGVDINAKDNDEWTPLHAASHWGQEEACKMLAERLCDMDAKNKAGQTALDVADTEIIKLLEELKLKQASLKDQQKDSQREIIQFRGPSSRRRSSVTRMSVEQKQNVILKTNEQERVTLSANLFKDKVEEGEKVIKSSSSSGSEEESSESETEKQNEINKQTSNINQPRDRDKPPIMATVEIRKPEMPKIEESNETQEKENLKNHVGGESDKGLTNETTVLIDDSFEKPQEKSENENEPKDIEKEKEKELEKEEKETEKEKDLDIKKAIIEEKTNDDKEKQTDVNKMPPPKEPLTKTSSAPVVPTVSIEDKTVVLRRPARGSASPGDANQNHNVDRMYEPPKRDEEAEMQRKSRAKKARQTRRSTQGVTLEEIKQAEKELKKTSSDDVNRTKTDTDKSHDSDRTRTTFESDKSRQDVQQDSSLRDNRTNFSSVDNNTRTNSTEDSSLSRWRSSREDRNGELRNSFRRSRGEPKDLSSSAPASSFFSSSSSSSTSTDPSSSSAYIPRNQRTALSTADIGNTPSLGPSVALTRSVSLRTPRPRNGEADDTHDDSKKSDKSEKEERRESTAMRAKRQRRERRSTGINSLTGLVDEDNEKNKENKEDEKKEERKTDSDDKSLGRYRFGSDNPSHLSDRYSRPSSYSEYSKSTPSLESDYKKLYEDEKYEKEKLRRELDHCKKELTEAKQELDRLMKRNEQSRISDTNDRREKRALERKLSELEEEVKKMDTLKADNQRLREENGALIRVISKLSK